MSKSSVSALQEYCAKNKIAFPVYEYIDCEEGANFACRVEVLGMEAHAYGRSKRDAKHLAAAHVIKKLRDEKHDIEAITEGAGLDVLPTHDMIVALRDFCVQNDHPLPVINIVQQWGTADAPEFMARCKLATITRYGVCDKKKDAKQKAAYAMLKAIMEDNPLEKGLELSSLQNKNLDEEVERRLKFKSYRQLTESGGSAQYTGVLLCDRHNYFCRYFDHLKKKALEVIDTEYESDERKAMDILQALKLTPKISEMKSLSRCDPNIFIELNCDLDAVFAGPKNVVYKQIINYFKVMLV